MRFLSTPSARRATRRVDRFLHSHRISIHALREEGDAPAFLPASGGRISIHALREEGDPVFSVKFRREYISIHALREEGDKVRTFIFFCPLGFLSTPSARRATFIFPRTFAVTEIFLSTPSARRATQFGPLFLPNGKNFYPRPPRGGRRTTKKPAVTVSMISIHALREEGDVRVILLWTSTPRFLSTPSARRATSYRRRGRGVIHDFYPRPPRGGRRLHHVLRNVPQDISIHALREEGDKSTSFSSCSSLEFLSTPSARRATQSWTA